MGRKMGLLQEGEYLTPLDSARELVLQQLVASSDLYRPQQSEHSMGGKG
jgi:hypothetical protein